MKSISLLGFAFCICLTATCLHAVQFSAPVPVGIDESVNLRGPSLSADELTIYYSVLTHPVYPEEMLFATRTSTSVPFGAGQPIFAGTEPNIQETPFISRNGLSLYYVTREYPEVYHSIYVSVRADTSAPFTPGQEISELSSDLNEWRPSVTADELTIMFESYRSGGIGGGDIYVSTRSNAYASFGTPVNTVTINSAERDGGPCISADGLTVFFYTDRMHPGTTDIWMATRPDLNSIFGSPTQIDEINVEGAGSWGPWISADNNRLYFVSNRAGGLPGGLWMATVIPEPSMFAAILSGLGIAFILRGKRK